MSKRFLALFAFLSLNLLFVAGMPAQQTPQNQSEKEIAYGDNFFDQLRGIFGKFRNSDLQKVFGEAKPIQCSELIGHKGEWRPLAFFNEDRTLGDWCRENLNEVKTDLVVYTFKGACSGDQAPIQVTTEYPTDESIRAYQRERIKLNQVDITVNDPVDAKMNPKTMAYTFDLPYLFRADNNIKKIYTFIAPDRNSTYAPEVSSHWECKTVSSQDVTYRFLICRVSLVPQRLKRNQTWEPSFGSSAFYILSDGMKAQSDVHITFGDGPGASDKPAQTEPAPKEPERPILKRDKKPRPGDD
jgi:hypothetical protein